MSNRSGNPSNARATIQVEAARHGDLPALIELLGMLFAQEREFRPDPERQRAGLTRILDHPGLGTVFVARLADRRVVGTCNLLSSVSTYLGAPAAWLEDVIVHPEWRGHGVGAALIDHVKRFALDQGIARISLLTDFDNTHAMRLYERAGFVRSSMLPMRLMLEE